MAALLLTPPCVALAGPKARQAARAPAKAHRLPACRLLRARPASRALRVCAQQEKVGTAAAAGPVTDVTWEELVIKSPVPVVVDFWAPWCGPCRMIAPTIDEIAVEYGEKLRVLKMNTDESPQTATNLGIRSIPTIMIYKGGQKMDAVIGAVPKLNLKQTIDKYL